MTAPFWVDKKYKQVSSDNFEEYMKALGVNVVLRKLGNMSKSTTSFTLKDGVWTSTIASTARTQVIEFKLGEEFEEDTIDGRKTKSTFTLDGNTLTLVQKGDKSKGEKDTTCVRTFIGDEMHTTLTCEGVVAKRVSKAD